MTVAQGEGVVRGREGGKGARRPGRLLRGVGGMGGREGGGWRAGWYDDKTFALSFRGMRGARGWLDVQPKGVGDGAGGR
jgi:hypothetical protein